MESVAVRFDLFEAYSLCADFVELEMDLFIRFDERSADKSALHPNDFVWRDLALVLELQYLHFFEQSLLINCHWKAKHIEGGEINVIEHRLEKLVLQGSASKIGDDWHFLEVIGLFDKAWGSSNHWPLN